MRQGLVLSSLFAAALASVAATASAEIVIPSMTYRTGPYASGGIPYSDGFADYITLLNERDGGIEGEPISLLECDFGYNTEKGVECFNELVDQGGLIFNPLSTGVTIAIMKKAQEEGIPLHTAGYGLTAVADGATYRYAFNFPAHYWHAATTQIAHLKELEGGSLEGKKIMHMHHNSGYGKEPIPTLTQLAEREGFELILNPIDHPGEDQDAAWDIIAETSPDYVLFWGWGIMNTVAMQQAAARDFPMDRLFGIWWSVSESDLKPLGDDVDGYKAVTFHAVGTGFRIFNDMNLLVYQTGKARGDMNNLGDVLYNRGVMSAIFATEAVRKAMKDNDTKEVTRAMVRDALEGFDMSADDLASLGMADFVPPVSISCGNHAGAGLVAVKQWDARIRKWTIVSDYYPPDAELIDPQISEASQAFAEKNNIQRTGC